MQHWEYAMLTWRRDHADVAFTHQETWRNLDPEGFWDTLRRLGDEGWEMLSVVEDLPGERSMYWFRRQRS